MYNLQSGLEPLTYLTLLCCHSYSLCYHCLLPFLTVDNIYTSCMGGSATESYSFMWQGLCLAMIVSILEVGDCTLTVT